MRLRYSHVAPALQVACCQRRPEATSIEPIKKADRIISMRWQLQTDAERLMHAIGLHSLAGFGTCEQRDERLKRVAAHAQEKDMGLVLQLRQAGQVRRVISPEHIVYYHEQDYAALIIFEHG